MPKDYAVKIEQHPVRNRWKGRGKFVPIAIVEHMMQGTLEETYHYFDGKDYAVSAHYGVGRDGRVWQFVADEDTAWANGVVQAPDPNIGWLKEINDEKINCNLVTLSIEYEGYSGDPLTQAQYEAAVALHQQLIERWELEADSQHIIGHNRIDTVERVNNPGTAFPLDQLLSDLSQVVQDGGGTSFDFADEIFSMPKGEITIVSPAISDPATDLPPITNDTPSTPFGLDSLAIFSPDTKPFTSNESPFASAPLSMGDGAAFSLESVPPFTPELKTSFDFEPAFKLYEVDPPKPFALEAVIEKELVMTPIEDGGLGQPSETLSPVEFPEFELDITDDATGFSFEIPMADTTEPAATESFSSVPIVEAQNATTSMGDFSLGDFLLDDTPTSTTARADFSLGGFLLDDADEPQKSSNTTDFSLGGFLLDDEPTAVGEVGKSAPDNDFSLGFLLDDADEATAKPAVAASDPFSLGSLLLDDEPATASDPFSLGSLLLDDEPATASDPFSLGSLLLDDEPAPPANDTFSLGGFLLDDEPVPVGLTPNLEANQLGEIDPLDNIDSLLANETKPPKEIKTSDPVLLEIDYKRARIGGGVIAVPLANIRIRPTFDEDTILKTAKQGERLKLDGWIDGPTLNKSTLWYHVSSKGGWIHSSLITLDKPFKAK